ncbi:MAG: hypothetical protein IKM73_13860 [Acidaminococcaceae bacterium]|nr:hypothetical protein [Acidaminococcaceae bacterium]
MKQKTVRRVRGSITILLVIILLGTMTFSAVVVDTSRLNMMRGMVDSAADLALNSALANYDTILKDVYGLFAMSQIKTPEDLQTELKAYFTKTLVSYGVTTEAEGDAYLETLLGDVKQLLAGVQDRSTGNFMNVEVQDFKVVRVENSALSNPEILRKQIVEYMKYRGPLTFGLSFLDSLTAFQRVSDQTGVVEKQVKAQESTQDVTAACRAVIDEIRRFDAIIDAAQDKNAPSVAVDNLHVRAVTGEKDKNDGQVVPLADYHSQVDKYQAAWGDNPNWDERYRDIHAMLLVFFQNPPTQELKDAWLRRLGTPDHPGNRFILKTEEFENGLNPDAFSEFDSDGITVSSTDGLAAALQQLEAQNSAAQSMAGAADRYYNLDYLPQSLVTAPGDGFSDEDRAMDEFARFARFLRNESGADGMQYSDVQDILRQLYRLKLAFDEYKRWQQGVIDQAKAEMDEAEGVRDDAQAQLNQANEALQNAQNASRDPSETIRNTIRSLNDDTLSPARDLVEEQGDAQIRTLVDGTLADFQSWELASGKDKYLDLFEDFLDATWTDPTSQKIIEEAQKAYDKDKSECKDKLSSFRMTGSAAEHVLYQLLNHILKAHSLVRYMVQLREDYENAQALVARREREARVAEGNYNEAEEDYESKERAHQREVDALNAKRNMVSATNSRFLSFTMAYQSDLDWYARYMTAAERTVTARCQAIAGQFQQIQDNIDAIVAQLECIEKKMAAAHTAIEAYKKTLDTWETANNTYAQAGKDSFSAQNTEDIQAARTEYDLDSLETLQACVKLVREDYQEFQARLKDNIHYKYGAARIVTIRDKDAALAAFRGSGHADRLSGTVTAQSARGLFGDLYASELTDQLRPMAGTTEQWHFLKPHAVPNQFLRYLNGTFPDTTEQTEEQKGTETNYETVLKELEQDQKPDYDDTPPKGAEGGDCGAAQNNGEPRTGAAAGYTYAKDPVAGDDLPSNGKSITIDEENFKLNQSDNKVNASDALGKQKSILGTVLNGIGSIAMAGVENLYVLDYIFENFSYRTIAEEQALKSDSGIEKSSPLVALGRAKALDVSSFHGQAKMLSNYSISAGNNYLYGAEAEYILYGNPDAEKNITSAKASIYAIRFAFDAIYAFTNSEIRNIARSVGFAVQMATMGIVPYQIVMVVVQLAMAAAEAKLDLDLMMLGLRVPVVKTKDTWALSPRGALNSLGELVADKAADLATGLIGKLSSGLQNLVDCGMENLSDAIKDVGDSASAAARGKVQEVTDQAFGMVQDKIEDMLNQLQFCEYQENALNFVNQKFDVLRGEIDTALEHMGSNPIVVKVTAKVREKVGDLINGVQQEVVAVIQSASDPGQALIEKMIEIKKNLTSAISSTIDSITDRLEEIAGEAVSNLQETLNDGIRQAENCATEAAAEAIREHVTEATNTFISEFIEPAEGQILGDGLSGTGGGMGSALASAIRFGYKDYLMLFTFIGLCIKESSDNILMRTADMIQLNIRHADGEYSHKNKKDFLMQDARTYVNVKAKVGLNMLFMRLDFFQQPLIQEGVSEESFGPATVITYNGLGGY